ncbi:MAG TPA: hypothetical protein VFJ16_28285 [Longimicrobium sp.]|nr:hypothetical protein [Longimicrobium sp.]
MHSRSAGGRLGRMAGLLGGAGLVAAAMMACGDSARGITGPAAGPEGGGSGVIATTGYSAVLGDDWKSYTSKAQLQSAGLFWWVDAAGRNVYDYVDLAQDPTFGQVVRITFPANTGSSGSSPRIAQDLPAPLDKVWYRFRVKFAPGWTSVGPDPSGWANSYKIAFMDWAGYNGRMEIEYSNSTDYITGVAVQTGSGTWVNYGSSLVAGSAPNFGKATTEWNDGEWWEFVMYYDKTGPTTASSYYWRRRLTSGGQVQNNPWVLFGENLSGNTTPQVSGIQLGINRNKNNPTTMYLYWGPWEVVDGAKYTNPFGMPNMGGSTTPPPVTVASLSVTPATAQLAPSAAQQFAATEVMSDGTTRAAAATWTASGGTVTSTGAYTAPAAAGTYSVIARNAGGMADTAVVTVSAQAPTLTTLSVTPATASTTTGGSVQLSATGTYSDGSSKAVTPAWTATGGTITAAGLYTAGQTAGTFRVIGTLGGKADTSVVTVAAPAAPTITALYLNPGTASTQTGGTVQFGATASYSDGTSKAVTPAYTATGGTITAAGLYTAGQTAGTFAVIASSGGKADTSAVTVSAPAAPPAAGSYTRVVGDDWKGYASSSALLSAGYFSGGTSSNVALVSDATFGQVARVTQPAGSTAMPALRKSFAAPIDRMWFRFRVRWSPGWTTAGSGTNAAEWSMARWTWSGYGGAGSLDFQNTREYANNWSAKNASNQYIQYTESLLPGSAAFGTTSTEWTGGGWWEYVVYWEKTGATTARQHYWMRPLGGSFRYYGFTENGAATPQAAAIQLGGNTTRAPTATQYVDWGPWEVVDGSRYANPFGMSGF